jgi:hypothetical protein
MGHEDRTGGGAEQTATHTRIEGSDFARRERGAMPHPGTITHAARAQTCASAPARLMQPPRQLSERTKRRQKAWERLFAWHGHGWPPRTTTGPRIGGACRPLWGRTAASSPTKVRKGGFSGKSPDHEVNASKKMTAPPPSTPLLRWPQTTDRRGGGRRGRRVQSLPAVPHTCSPTANRSSPDSRECGLVWHPDDSRGSQ